jgi:hypothetical protein
MQNATFIGDITAMSYFLQGFGVFLGVLAGTAITILTKLFFIRRTEIRNLENLKFEIEFNIKRIDKWLIEIRKYRNAVNGDSLSDYYGYFDLASFLSPTLNNMYNNGSLYKYFNHDDIETLQEIYSEFSEGMEDNLNNQIEKNKEYPKEDWPIHKPEIVQQIDVWEDTFIEHKKSLQDIVKRTFLTLPKR